MPFFTTALLPPQWNEPISLLQRVAEYMNYAYLLKMAAAQKVKRGNTNRAPFPAPIMLQLIAYWDYRFW